MESRNKVSSECPVCKHPEASQVIEGTSNDIYGPGYHFHKTNEYYICEKCGVHYNNPNETKD